MYAEYTECDACGDGLVSISFAVKDELDEGAIIGSSDEPY